jgi:hypothetical protein
MLTSIAWSSPGMVGSWGGCCDQSTVAGAASGKNSKRAASTSRSPPPASRVQTVAERQGVRQNRAEFVVQVAPNRVDARRAGGRRAARDAARADPGTVSTIGFGDITPLSLQARYAAVAEGVTGQFYLAILVARLVGLQMSRFDTRRGGSA